MDLLKLKVRHVYETTPGNVNSKFVIDGCEVDFRLLRKAPPYKDIGRFLATDKLISSGRASNRQSNFDGHPWEKNAGHPQGTGPR